MTKSMTGYGKSELNLAAGKLTIEIRTLNSKGCDINFKSQIIPKEKEIQIRQKIAAELQRGTIDVFLSFEANASGSARAINADLVSEYFRQIEDIRRRLNMESQGSDMEKTLILGEILKFSDIMDSKRQDIIDDSNWPDVEKAFEEALEAVNSFRIKEGEVLYKDVTSRVQTILDLDEEVEALETERLEAVRARISKAMEDLSLIPDQSRFEQEMIYYLEKLDINEEKVRLRQHCKYFIDTIDNEDYPGKKLGFIIQEMGREINTTGSKANHAGIQKTVVMMKDELEKIREQSMNIL